MIVNQQIIITIIIIIKPQYGSKSYNTSTPQGGQILFIMW